MNKMQALLPVNLPPQEVADFPDGCERSCQGAVYFLPGRPRYLTRGECEHIRTKHPEVYSLLIVGKV